MGTPETPQTLGETWRGTGEGQPQWQARGFRADLPTAATAAVSTSLCWKGSSGCAARPRRKDGFEQRGGEGSMV